CHGKRLGVESHAYGLTAQRGKMVDAALDGFCRTEDASDLVRLLRLVKSPAELAYVRRAGQLADEALAVANRTTVPGASVGAIYGEMQHAILAGVDGLAHGLHRQSPGAGPGHGVLRPHDPAQQPHGSEHVSWRDVDHHRERLRSRHPRPPAACRELTRPNGPAAAGGDHPAWP